ncbi:MAG: DUF481 domain-containing protein [Haliscomenobacteraceae bacterium CHB4]|nr:hypothetical protein [Saprospiraceae bacterium]MCE7921608.1 DUF481 domain-containing protein [Haliscomenobacteraceae bacterium CHB4]
MRIICCIILFCGALNNRLAAQINESDTLLFQYNTSLGGNLQSGNLKAAAVRLKADLSLAPSPQWAFKTQNSYRYQEFFERKADNDFYSRNFFYLWQHRRVYPFAMTFVSTNFRRKIDFRYFAGIGATWQIVRRPRHTVKAALSGVHESTRFAGSVYNYPEYDGSDNVDTWRATWWLFGKHLLTGRHLRLYYETFVQPSVQRGNNFRWQIETGLEWPVWKGLSFTVSYIFTHENVVIRNITPDDGLLTFGIAFNRKVKAN